jgi:hypothetical protein
MDVDQGLVCSCCCCCCCCVAGVFAYLLGEFALGSLYREDVEGSDKEDCESNT